MHKDVEHHGRKYRLIVDNMPTGFWDGFVYDLTNPTAQCVHKVRSRGTGDIDREFVKLKLLEFIAHLTKIHVPWHDEQE